MKGPARAALAIATSVLAAVALSGCGRLQQLVDHPTPPHADANDIVWQVTYGPGFTSQEIALATRPSITVYGDGRFLVRPPDPTGDPWNIATFEQGLLPDDELAELETTIAGARVFEDPDVDLGNPGVMDAGSTSVRGLGPDGEPVELDAYALGDGGTDELSDTQRDLRARLDALVSDIEVVVPDNGSATYVPDRLEVFGVAHLYPLDDDRTPQVWPGVRHTTLFAGRAGDLTCAAVSGPDVAPILAAAQSNPGLTWSDQEGTFYAVVRIALPGVTACQD